MREHVVFKGNRDGLQLWLNEAADFNEILCQLKTKLESAAKFFNQGMQVTIPAASRALTSEQQGQLTDLFAGYGLTCMVVDDLPAAQLLAEQPVAEPVLQSLVVSKTLRSGQEVIYSGTIEVFGDVNPGAEVIAGGDIIIHGACRGIVHAGAYGNEEAVITAERLMATQIRIASMIARSPDTPEYSSYAETAKIKDGTVIIEPADI